MRNQNPLIHFVMSTIRSVGKETESVTAILITLVLHQGLERYHRLPYMVS